MFSFLKSESEGEDVVDVPGVADIPPVQRLQEELPSEESDPEVEEPAPAVPCPLPSECEASVELPESVPLAGPLSSFSFGAQRKRRPGAGRPSGTFGTAHVRALLRTAVPPVQFAAPPVSAGQTSMVSLPTVHRDSDALVACRPWMWRNSSYHIFNALVELIGPTAQVPRCEPEQRHIELISKSFLRNTRASTGNWIQAAQGAGFVGRVDNCTKACQKAVKATAEAGHAIGISTWLSFCRDIFEKCCASPPVLQGVALIVYTQSDETPLSQRCLWETAESPGKAVCKVLQWATVLGMVVRDIDSGEFRSYRFEIATPLQVLDHNTAECLREASCRTLAGLIVPEFEHRFRQSVCATTEDLAAANVRNFHAARRDDQQDTSVKNRTRLATFCRIHRCATCHSQQFDLVAQDEASK